MTHPHTVELLINLTVGNFTAACNEMQYSRMQIAVFEVDKRLFVYSVWKYRLDKLILLWLP